MGDPGPECVVDSGAQVSLLVTEVPVGNPGPKCVVASAAGVLLTPVPKLVYLLPGYPSGIRGLSVLLPLPPGYRSPGVYLCLGYPSGIRGISVLLPLLTGYVSSPWFWADMPSYMLGKFQNPLKISKQRVRFLERCGGFCNGPKRPRVFLPLSIPAASLAIVWFGGEKFTVRSC